MFTVADYIPATRTCRTLSDVRDFTGHCNVSLTSGHLHVVVDGDVVGICSGLGGKKRQMLPQNLCMDHVVVRVATIPGLESFRARS